MGGLFEELRRRNVFRVGAAYLVVAWLVAQVADVFFDGFDAPPWALKALLLVLVIGFPVSLVFAWVYELTPEGVKREVDVDRAESVTRQTGRKLDVVITGALVLALGYFVWESRFREEVSTGTGQAPEDIAAVAAEGAVAGPKVSAEKSVAVLPFVPLSSGPDDEFFADGLTEEIINSLAQLPEIMVTARTSAFHFKGRDVPITEIAESLGVGHVVEGSVRRSGDRLRVTAQLIRASDGFHVWSSTYDRELKDVFSVQDDIAQSIAASLDVILDEAKRQSMRVVGARDPQAFIAFQKGMALYDQAHADIQRRNAILREANAEFSRAVELAPELFSAWMMQADLYIHELFDAASGGPLDAETLAELPRAPDRLQQALDAARRNATRTDERDAAEFTRRFMSNEWRGLGDVIDQVFAHDGCMRTLYAYTMVVLGRADAGRQFYERRVACSPLDSDTLWGRVMSIFLQGEFREALEVAREVTERLGPVWWVGNYMVFSHLALRDYEAAHDVLASAMFDDNGRLFRRVMIEAAEGRVEDARVTARERMARSDPGKFVTTLFAAWTGDRETANRLAGEIDARPAGPAQLVTMLSHCQCGAPFDLSATPNLAARLDEAGLPWPPPALIRFPAKDW